MSPQRSLLWRFLQMVVRIATTVALDLKVYGRRHVPRHGGALLVANHQSFLDPPLVAAHLYRPVSFMARHGLFENRYFGWLIRSLDAYPVRQGEGDVAAIKETVRRLNEGALVNIYPEGSRTDDGEISRIEPGIGLVARRAGVLIVPVVVDGAHLAWHKDRKLPRAHPVRLMYGEPFGVDGMKADQIVQRIDQTLRLMLCELREKQRAEATLRGHRCKSSKP